MLVLLQQGSYNIKRLCICSKNIDIGPEKTNPFDTGSENPGYDETGEMNEMDRFPPTSSRRGSEDIINPRHHRTHGETSFGGDISDSTPLIDHLTVQEQKE